jgi:hypothetical protein
MNPPEHLGKVIQRWEERRQEWSRLRVQVDGAALAKEVVADLEHIAEADNSEELTLSAAAALSGYSRDHLARLIREGAIRNAGKRGKPRIYRIDLPIRPASRVAALDGGRYDPITDARFLRVRR